MKPTLALLVACLGLLGCGKSKNSASAAATNSTQSETASGEQDAAQTAASPNPVAPAVPDQASSAQPIGGVVDPDLTAQLRVFVQQRGRLPESFAEFAGARLDSVPRLPRGLGYAIDPATQEVKIVKK